MSLVHAGKRIFCLVWSILHLYPNPYVTSTGTLSDLFKKGFGILQEAAGEGSLSGIVKYLYATEIFEKSEARDSESQLSTLSTGSRYECGTGFGSLHEEFTKSPFDLVAQP